MPQYNHVKVASKGVLHSPNSLHHLPLIVDQRRGDWIEKALCDSSISSRNEGRLTSHTLTSGRSCPKEIFWSEHENLWPQGSLMTQTVIKARVKRWMKRWETRPKYPKDNTKPLSVQCQISVGKSCEPSDSANIQMNTRGHVVQEAKRWSIRVEENEKGWDEWWRSAK